MSSPPPGRSTGEGKGGEKGEEGGRGGVSGGEEEREGKGDDTYFAIFVCDVRDDEGQLEGKSENED